MIQAQLVASITDHQPSLTIAIASAITIASQHGRTRSSPFHAPSFRQADRPTPAPTPPASYEPANFYLSLIDKLNKRSHSLLTPCCPPPHKRGATRPSAAVSSSLHRHLSTRGASRLTCPRTSPKTPKTPTCRRTCQRTRAETKTLATTEGAFTATRPPTASTRTAAATRAVVVPSRTW